MHSRPFTRRGFLAGTVPFAAGLPLLKDVFCSADPAAKEAHRATGLAHHAGARGSAATRELLVPPPAEPARPGRVRELELVAENRTVEVAPGVVYPAWTYNGTVPGPVIRATEGDEMLVHFRNEGEHPHTVHFHGAHRPSADGVLEPVPPGGRTTYRFRAGPAGLHLYHCHTAPLAEHMARGLYGTFIVDPKEARPDAQELVLVLSAFDTDGDGRNEIYAVNGRAFAYDREPIVVRRNRPLRIYLVNATEYDPVSSLHLHAAMFRCSRTGTVQPPELADTVMLCQGERAVLEIDFEHRGLYMFHPHQSRAMELGAMGWFSVVDTDVEAAGAAVTLNGYAQDFADCDPCIDELAAKALLKY